MLLHKATTLPGIMLGKIIQHIICRHKTLPFQLILVLSTGILKSIQVIVNDKCMDKY
jgi:hypothetical protein